MVYFSLKSLGKQQGRGTSQRLGFIAPIEATLPAAWRETPHL